jgi:hypothetical protein
MYPHDGSRHIGAIFYDRAIKTEWEIKAKLFKTPHQVFITRSSKLA